MFALPLLQALPANQSHSRQSSDNAGQKSACPGSRQSHKPSYRAEGEPSGAIRQAGEPRTWLELRRPLGPRCLGYSPNPLPPRSLKLLHGVQWQTPVRRTRLQSHGRPRWLKQRNPRILQSLRNPNPRNSWSHPNPTSHPLRRSPIF